MNTIVDECRVLIKNLPNYGQNDEEDIDKLFRNSLGLNIRAKSIRRARSRHYSTGVVTIELATEDDKNQVMKAERKLRYTDIY